MTNPIAVLSLSQLAPLLDCVSKPARYTGVEYNRVIKTSRPEFTHVALCFPDVYEIGMSHLGLKILYHILNQRADVWAQRCFSPWPDMESQLRQRQLPLFSLEEHRALSFFDIVGFSLQYELSLTNVLQILDLAGIPVRQHERHAGPLIVAGGPCCANPEPLSLFFDVCVVGEAEELIQELIDCYRRFQSSAFLSGGGRIRPEEKQRLLRELARIPGIYVPSLYRPRQLKGVTVGMESPDASLPLPIRRRVVIDLNATPAALQPPVSIVEAVQDRVAIEIMRGCPNQCYFCQAGFTTFPVRIKQAARALQELRHIYAATGYESVAFCALSSAQYPFLEDLIRDAYAFCKEHGMAITLPSLRIDDSFVRILGAFNDLKKTVLTFAPEAGSERLRRLINKQIDIPQMTRVIQQAYCLGWQRIKFYFMIGLPTETDEDLQSLVELVRHFSGLRVGNARGRSEIIVSIGNFIPKPHTPFQWLGMESIDALRAKQDYLRRAFRGQRVRLSFHDAAMSYVEAYIARAGREAAGVIQTVYEQGRRFDGWSNSFLFAPWQQAIEQAAAEEGTFPAHKQRALDDWLPWQHIECGITIERLREIARPVVDSMREDVV